MKARAALSRLIAVGLVLATCGPAAGAVTPPGMPGQTILPQIAAVQKYVLDKDYPEVFGDKHYKTKVQNAVIADLDGDGQAEVIIHFMPHYRQSPTIMIYRVAPDMTVKRVLEGLAPGPLQPLSGEFLDSHTLKGSDALDLSLGEKQNDAKVRHGFSADVLEKGMSVVEYANFIHLDSRAGRPVFIDMTSLVAPSKSDKCDDFEFSAVREISAGTVSALGAGNLLAAWVQAKVYLYRIKSFPAAGLLDKEMWTVDVPADFRGFAPGAEGALKYLTPSGAEKPFAVQCSGHNCTLAP